MYHVISTPTLDAGTLVQTSLGEARVEKFLGVQNGYPTYSLILTNCRKVSGRIYNVITAQLIPNFVVTGGILGYDWTETG